MGPFKLFKIKKRGLPKMKNPPPPEAKQAEPVKQDNLFELNNLSAKDFERLLKFGKPSNKVGPYESKDFVELPYGLVKKDIPNLQKQELFEDIILAVLNSQFDEVDLADISGNELMAFLLWIKQQIQFIYDIELNYLSSDPDPKMVAAGIHLLAQELGELPTIDQLAGGDVLKYDLIEALPYYKIYEKLKLEKLSNEISKRYEEIIKNTK